MHARAGTKLFCRSLGLAAMESVGTGSQSNKEPEVSDELVIARGLQH